MAKTLLGRAIEFTGKIKDIGDRTFQDFDSAKRELARMLAEAMETAGTVARNMQGMVVGEFPRVELRGKKIPVECRKIFSKEEALEQLVVCFKIVNETPYIAVAEDSSLLFVFKRAFELRTNFKYHSASGADIREAIRRNYKDEESGKDQETPEKDIGSTLVGDALINAFIEVVINLAIEKGVCYVGFRKNKESEAEMIYVYPFEERSEEIQKIPSETLDSIIRCLEERGKIDRTKKGHLLINPYDFRLASGKVAHLQIAVGVGLEDFGRSARIIINAVEDAK